MAVDLALDRATGDLAVSPNNDIGIVRGSDVIDQRIRVRLKVPVGDWTQQLSLPDDLGSRLLDQTRLPVDRALLEIPMVVEEALAPMNDIRVVGVDAFQDPQDSPTDIRFTILYTIIDGDSESDAQQFNGALQLTAVT